MIEEYVYKAGMARAEIIDKTLWSILRARRPKTYAILNVIQWPIFWKLAGIRVEVRHKVDQYEEYDVFQYDQFLASFSLRTNIAIS